MKKVIILIVIILMFGITFFLYFNVNKNKEEKEIKKVFLASNMPSVDLLDEDFVKVNEAYRCSEVIVSKEDEVYTNIIYNDISYFVSNDNLVDSESLCVLETKMYVRTPVNVYSSANDINLISLFKKGSELDITGYSGITDGIVDMYKVKYNDVEGYVYSKYLVDTKEASFQNYDEDGLYLIHSARGDNYGGGSGANLDYYPYLKANFEDNVMPKDIRSLYINASAIKDVDSYIDLAKSSNINAFVVDIKDNTNPAYPANAMAVYSKTNYDNAYNFYEEYKSYIKKLKDNGFYVIGRVTLFKDSFYINDHPESAISSSLNNEPYSHNGSYWPSAYDRSVWEFNVALAIESVKEMGFNEIQFDYVRFPDRIGYLEENGIINMKNIYNEEKAQAIQAFLMYACDEIHKYNAYVSADVFGESAHTYITGYGQYWPAISNIVDVISAMPYPDHFNINEYGINEPVWQVPYQLLTSWGSYAHARQKEIPTPAIARTWIQTYDAIRSPYVIYDSNKVSEEIKALYDSGLTGGFITWNSASSLSKYKSVSDAFKKEY